LAWLAIFVAFSLALPQSFPTLRNLETLSRQTAIVGVASLGMTLVIVAGGIDLSVGSVAALAAVVAATVAAQGADPTMAALAAIVVGAGVGALNGSLVAGAKLSPFIVTLSTLLAMRGLAKGVANEQAVRAPGGWIESLLASLPPGRGWQLAAPGVWLLLALAIGTAFLLGRTQFGRQLVAVGSNERAATYSAIPVRAVKIKAFVLCGALAGLAGLLFFSRLRVGDPTIAQGFELDVVAAAVIGGASLSGGQGSIAGSILGALVMSTIRAGGSQLGWSNWVQEVATGAIILAAVAIDRLRVANSHSRTP
jgi:ribose transport system permease protein